MRAHSPCRCNSLDTDQPTWPSEHHGASWSGAAGPSLPSAVPSGSPRAFKPARQLLLLTRARGQVETVAGKDSLGETCYWTRSISCLRIFEESHTCRGLGETRPAPQQLETKLPGKKYCKTAVRQSRITRSTICNIHGSPNNAHLGFLNSIHLRLVPSNPVVAGQLSEALE